MKRILGPRLLVVAALAAFALFAAPAQAVYFQGNGLLNGQPIPTGTTWTYLFQYVGPCDDDCIRVQLIILGENGCYTVADSWCTCSEPGESPTMAAWAAAMPAAPAGSPYAIPVTLNRPMNDPHSHVIGMGPPVFVGPPCP